MMRRRIRRLLRNGERQLPRPRIFRDRTHPWDMLNDDQFIANFRFCRDAVQVIVDIISVQLERPTARSSAFSPMIQVLATLQYYISNARQFDVSNNTYIMSSQPSISRQVKEVSRLLADEAIRTIGFPTGERLLESKAIFFALGTIPDVAGVIDCTHIRLMTVPAEHAFSYRNRKVFYSINCQVVVDGHGKICNIVARWPGSRHDSFILRHSQLWGQLHRGEVPGILVGDSGYPLCPFLLTPYPQRPRQRLPGYQARYNAGLSQIRVNVEMLFGRMKRR